jgi:hypothetical protein
MSRALAALGATCAVSIAASAAAGDFDVAGNYVADPDAVAAQDFGAGFDAVAGRYLPADAPPNCATPAFAQVFAPDALDGDAYIALQTNIFAGCAERFLVELPKIRGSYRATMWTRHAAVDAQMTILYPEGTDLVVAKMGPTGRTTSDGWVELATNPFPVDGTQVQAAYVRVYDYDDTGTELDAIEVVPAGDYLETSACTRVGDPACRDDEVCIQQLCRRGDLYVPPLPEPRVRQEMVDMMQSQLRVFFGGRKTRLAQLPEALAELESIRRAESGWAFWNGWATSIRLLQDWHTRANGSMGAIDRRKRLNLCFIQGDGDASALQWPKDASYPDVLVSHVGGTDGTYGIGQGDRLVAVDGRHPIAWARDLVDEDWGHWRANTDGVYAELLERMRGLILRFAESFDVIHCNPVDGTCADGPTHYVVAEIPDEEGRQPSCDNRPAYHYPSGATPDEFHQVGSNFYSGRVVEAPVDDAVYGLMWDTLYGAVSNDPIRSAFAEFKEEARGVILDHRAGNGGTLDGAEAATELSSPPRVPLVFVSPIELGGWNGPESLSEGVALFDALAPLANYPMHAGSTSYDPDMPVALITHRDGSASDFFPFAMKGASPKVRIFGPGPTAGAFSTFYELEFYGGITWALASGDSIAADGSSLIGHGVVPDVVVQQKQSDLLAGRDTLHEEALAWVRQELKP